MKSPSSLLLLFALLVLPDEAGAFVPPPCGATKNNSSPRSSASPISITPPDARSRRGGDAATATTTRLRARPQTRYRQVQGNILNRRTINEFEPALPTHWERSLENAILAAMHAPNHKRTEPWRFYLLGPRAIRKVCELNAELVTEKKGEVAGAKKLERWLKMPGWLVVTCVKSGDDDADGGGGTMKDPAGTAREDYAATCCAVQNLCLSLDAQGLGTKWTTGAVNFDERFAGAVGFDDGEEHTVGTIWFGEAKRRPLAPRKKRGLEDVLKRVE